MTVDIQNTIINLNNVLKIQRQADEIEVTFIGGYKERYRLPNMEIAIKIEDEIIGKLERM
jgi:hypothetical protein